MASISLPRVLQLKKNSLDAEREQFEKFQTLAIQKAINAVETPVKEKHVRSTIIGTFQEQSAITYWMVAIRLPLQDNRIVAWKFCHVTHKLLREGHPACLNDSQRHIGMIQNLSKLWVHLREGYGRLVSLYCDLLVSKLRFHARNPRFPGNMDLTSDELDAIAENDVNNYFQLCVELFDYMDDILNLQEAVFDSLGNARANSMTASGQCRLAALIPCAQDSSQIYDCNVRLLFRLHAALPADTLSGHRERFRQQFKKLSSFYKHASSLQYYRNLLTLPLLPSNPPNFLQQSEFGTYVRPVVSVPEPADEPDTSALIDTSDVYDHTTTSSEQDVFEVRTTPSPQPDQLVERDRLIEHLQTELKRMRSEVSQMVQERNSMLNSMREHCTRLENELQTTKTELEEEKQKAETLSSVTPEIEKKLSETETKAKATDEKFQKLKGAYTQLREEHIKLIRQKAEVDKTAATLRAAAAEHESAKMSLQQQLNDKVKDVELLQQSASSSEEIEAYKNEIATLRAEIEQSRQQEVQLETLKASMEALQIEHNTAKTESEEKLNLVISELKEVKEEFIKVKEEKEVKENELVRVKEELQVLREKSGDEYKRAVQEKEAAQLELASLTQKYHQEKQEKQSQIEKIEAEYKTLKEKLNEMENNLELETKRQLQVSKENLEKYDTILQEKDAEIANALESINNFENEINRIKSECKTKESQLGEKNLELKHEIELLSKDKESLCLLIQNIKDNHNNAFSGLETKTQSLEAQIRSELDKSNILQKEITEKACEILELNKDKQDLVKELEKQKSLHEDLEKESQLSLIKLQDKIKQHVIQIDQLNEQIEENNKIMSEEGKIKVSLQNDLEALQSEMKEKDKTISQLQVDIDKSNKIIDSMNIDINNNTKEHQLQIALLQDKLQNAIASKDEIINNLKNSLSEKDEKVINLSVEVRKLNEDLQKAQDEMMEQAAELEIGQNELLNLNAEHDALMNNNDQNLAMKNQELRSMSERINQLIEEINNISKEKEIIISESLLAKQAYESQTNVLQNEVDTMKADLIRVEANKKEVETQLKDDIYKLTIELSELQESNQAIINDLTSKLHDDKRSLSKQMSMKDILLEQSNREIDSLKEQINTINSERKEETMLFENDKKSLESRLSHVEKEKINSECELQDLLQHNTALEENVVALKKELEEAKKEVEKQRCSLVTCASTAALQVTRDALTALESGSPMENNRAAAELAARTLDELATCAQLSDKEEAVAKSAILAAHNTAQLSYYVTDVSNASTDLAVADKLITECRSMLSSTKQCLESLVSGSACDAALTRDTSTKVRAVLRTASEADSSHAAARNVDDELADMDRAIEMAATQIEDLLRASRAADSGIKLEVHGAILDACTSLMGAVREVVRESRALQESLGDVATRRHVYRRNPQWSEGLISASKAVVFAAKLLVSSADDTVSGAGRAENVSAAAHEVAASSAQLVSACRARAPPGPRVSALVAASRTLAAHTAAVVAAVRHAAALTNEQEALDTSSLTLTATRRLEMESKVRSLELETALDAERVRLAALRKRHYQLAQVEENGNMTNGKEK